MNASASINADVFDFTLPPQPYPGLRPFSKEEWPIFFGRERMLDEVIDRLLGQCLFVVHGDSGCGKSSLIRAGVLPRLEQQFARGGAGWVTCITTPGDAPLENLAAAIAGVTGADDEDRRHEIRRILNSGAHGAAALAQYVAARRSEHVCILIDQFEELFAHARHHGRQQAGILIALLIGLHKLADPRLRVVLTTRSEFLGACAQYDGFAQAVNATQYLLPRMEAADLMRAIQEPATLYDGDIATSFAERLITEAGGTQDQLPLIQHALMQLYGRRRSQADNTWRLDMADYPASGLRGLLSEHADKLADSVKDVPDAARIVEEMFRALTEVNADHQAIRRPQTLEALIKVTRAREGDVRKLIDAFRAEGASLLRPYGDAPVELDDSVDISHEALIRCWAKIADEKTGWLVREFEDGITWSALLVQCESFEKNSGNVLSPATTEERRNWLAGRNEDWAKRYGGGWDRVQKLMVASIAARDEQTQQETRARRMKIFRWGFAITSVLMFVAIYATISAIDDREKAEESQQVAEVSLASASADRARLAADQRAADDLIKSLQGQLKDLKEAAAKAPADSTIRQSINNANSVIQQQVQQYNTATRSQPRIYVHISDESQRAAARAFVSQLTGPTRALLQITVPGIELLKEPLKDTFLRCFDARECKEYGADLAQRVNDALEYPQVGLQDFSGTFTDKSTIRPLHFELYFGLGDIVPRGAKAATKK
jgi:hypothetical protein